MNKLTTLYAIIATLACAVFIAISIIAMHHTLGLMVADAAIILSTAMVIAVAVLARNAQ